MIRGRDRTCSKSGDPLWMLTLSRKTSFEVCSHPPTTGTAIPREAELAHSLRRSLSDAFFRPGRLGNRFVAVSRPGPFWGRRRVTGRLRWDCVDFAKSPAEPRTRATKQASGRRSRPPVIAQLFGFKPVALHTPVDVTSAPSATTQPCFGVSHRSSGLVQAAQCLTQAVWLICRQLARGVPRGPRCKAQRRRWLHETLSRRWS